MAIGDDAKRFRWDRKGDDLALIFAGGGLREAADLGHDAILSLGSSRTSAASMRIGWQQGDGAAARRARSAGEEGAIRLSWLAGNGGTPGGESRRRAVAASGTSVSGCVPARASRRNGKGRGRGEVW